MNPRYRIAKFEISAKDIAQMPPDRGLEVAFAGRSNSGKSSALNALTDQKSLARTSKTPGRTQLINFFKLAEDRYLVDLPGYGYAKVPVAVRRHWGATMRRYLSDRRALRGLILLMDVRHPLTPLDRQLLDWCAQRELPSHILLTKADKLRRGPATTTLAHVKRALNLYQPLVTVQLFSAVARSGIEQAHATLDNWFGYRADDTM